MPRGGGAPFGGRLERIAGQDLSLAQLLGNAVATDAHRAPEVRQLACDERLSDTATQLAGCAIDERISRFRYNSPALPNSRQLWHSDVTRVTGPCSTVTITAWIPLSDAGPGSGGLEIVPGKQTGPLPHSHVSNKIFISEKKLAGKATVCPEMRAGDCLFLDRFTPHRSVENLSGRTRWSLVIWMKRAASAPPDQTSSMRATLAANLKVLRKQRGLSQDALAAAGIDRTYISALERQRYGAGLDTIELLARALGVEPDRLIKTDCAADQV